MRLILGYALGIAVVVVSMTGVAFAGQIVPEVDATTVSAGLGLLTAGVLIIRSKRRK